jgi:hypothetical protein
MFPYAIISASRLLGAKNKNTPEPPLIETLQNYIQMPTAQFHALLVEKSETVGLLEMCEMISNWKGFDRLSEKQKLRFVKETIDPTYYSIWNRLKRMFMSTK